MLRYEFHIGFTDRDKYQTTVQSRALALGQMTSALYTQLVGTDRYTTICTIKAYNLVERSAVVKGRITAYGANDKLYGLE